MVYTLHRRANAIFFRKSYNTIINDKKISMENLPKGIIMVYSVEKQTMLFYKDKGVKIWNKNANGQNDLGPIYGHQWRHFNATYSQCIDDYTNKGVDQLQNIIDSLKNENERFSRRLILNAWNPCQLHEMALPPCHILSQFIVTNTNELSCVLYQRSGDIGLGIPFNIASYSFLTHLLG